jgi:hypothetical protein
MTGVRHRLAGNPLAFLNGVRLRITFLAAGDAGGSQPGGMI